ncbi:MAG: hypothetical protein JO303_07420 [Caulobacteraceae bacterium]|nr:hypothetical protein [Caulobacteraceae bacterium]
MSAFAELSRDDLQRSLMNPVKFGPCNALHLTMASLRKDGSPFAIPLDFWYNGQFMYITMSPGRTGVARLRRDPRVSLYPHLDVSGQVHRRRGAGGGNPRCGLQDEPVDFPSIS